MKIFLTIKVYSTENQSGLTYEKVFESKFVPKIGEKIKDSLFVELKNVVDVIYDFSCSECYVILTSKEVPNDRLDGHIQEVAEMHNWVQKKDKE